MASIGKCLYRRLSLPWAVFSLINSQLQISTNITYHRDNTNTYKTPTQNHCNTKNIIMASELVDKLKETLQPQEHTAFQGESRSSDEQPQRSTRNENQSFSGQTYDENPSRNENVSFNTNTFESSRNTNLETSQNENESKPRRYSGQQYKSLLGDVNTAMPRNAQRHKEFVSPNASHPLTTPSNMLQGTCSGKSRL